jgi:hypothetical protein
MTVARVGSKYFIEKVAFHISSTLSVREGEPGYRPRRRAAEPLRANRADQAGLVVQDVARSSLRKLIQRACLQCHRVVTATTLNLLDTKYKAHLQTCRRMGRSA